MNENELNQLIDGLLDSDISDADRLRLEAELLVSSEARHAYYARVQLDTLLEQEALQLPRAMEPVTTRPVANHSVIRLLALGALAGAGLFGIGWVAMNLGDGLPAAGKVASTAQPAGADSASPTEDEAADRGFAVIAGQVDVVWPDGLSRPDGSLVDSESLHILSGLLHLEFFSGVSVVVEGEAKLEVLSPMHMRVAIGKVRAEVPDAAKGFTIVTDTFEAVDLGTVFGVNAGAGHAEIHVLDGEVLCRDASAQRLLTTGQAVVHSAGGGQQDISIDPLGFISAEHLREQQLTQQAGRLAAWETTSTQMLQNDDLVALYRFGEGSTKQRQLENLASSESSSAAADASQADQARSMPKVSHGAIVAAKRTADRWGRSENALDFSPAGSRVRLNVAGEFSALTLACWVKINSLDRLYNSLFLTDGHDLHEPHWQIMNDGRLFFSVKKRDAWKRSQGERDKHVFFSPPLWDRSLSGKWLMIATTYSPARGEVVHFVNGQAISREAIPEDYVVERIKIGNASLGNWGLPERNDPNFAIRNLNGSMDEFAMYSEALTATQILQLYEDGRP